MTGKEKQFKLKDVQNNLKELEKVSKFYIDEDKTMFINFHPKFSKKKTHDLLIDLSEALKQVNELKLDFLTNDLELIQYAQFLIIKHFTSLKQELNNKSLEVHIETMYKLIETGLFDRFFTEMFDEAEVYELLNELDQKAEIGLEILRIQNELSKQLQTDFLKKKEG